ASSQPRLRRARPAVFTIALRVPGWARQRDVALSVNDTPFAITVRSGYAMLTRRWQEGDVVVITIPLELRIEAAPGDPDLIAVLRGPMVLAGDLGPAAAKWNDVNPALISDESLLARFAP